MPGCLYSNLRDLRADWLRHRRVSELAPSLASPLQAGENWKRPVGVRSASRSRSIGHKAGQPHVPRPPLHPDINAPKSHCGASGPCQISGCSCNGAHACHCFAAVSRNWSVWDGKDYCSEHARHILFFCTTPVRVASRRSESRWRGFYAKSSAMVFGF